MHLFSFAPLSFRSRSQHKATRLLFLIISIWLTIQLGFAQANVKNLLYFEPDTTVFTIIEKQPEFPGGRQALQSYLLTTVHYPPEAKKLDVIGRVFISFIVEADGQLADVQLLKGIGFGCDEEAIRVIKAMPRWQPGSQSGKSLRVRYKLPVHFGIDYPKVKIR